MVGVGGWWLAVVLWLYDECVVLTTSSHDSTRQGLSQLVGSVSVTGRDRTALTLIYPSSDL